MRMGQQQATKEGINCIVTLTLLLLLLLLLSESNGNMSERKITNTIDHCAAIEAKTSNEKQQKR